MRVIAGTAKGRRLVAPKGERTRPTADRVKEALFSSLQTRLQEASVLDLYAGSGALGIEALSRGARHATFVERHSAALRSLHHNLEVTNLVDRASVVGREVAAALEMRLAGAPFDLVLIDPPYALAAEDLATVLALLLGPTGGPGPLVPGALVSLELGVRTPPPAWPPGLGGVRERRYGDTVLHLAAFDSEHERSGG